MVDDEPLGTWSIDLDRVGWWWIWEAFEVSVDRPVMRAQGRRIGRWRAQRAAIRHARRWSSAFARASRQAATERAAPRALR